MSEPVKPFEAEKRDERAGWDLPLQAVVCRRCDWGYLVPPGPLPERCPHCMGGPLVAFDLESEPRPERVLPFSLSAETLAAQVDAFARGIPFPPADLKAPVLKQRLSRLFLPEWLVDGEVGATWAAEAGFNYEVVSHQEQYNQNRAGWETRQVTETRVRWEPRVGRLSRGYANLPAPALEESAALHRALGPGELDGSQEYAPELVKNSWIRLPNRSPEDAWPDVVPVFRERAQQECHQAIGSDHIRNFQWTPEFQSRHWTLLLEPVYTTYYLDDAGHPQPVLIHGRSGRISGVRRASMKRAQTAALWLVGGGIILFILSLLVGVVGAFFPPLLVVSGLGILVAALVGLGALIPIGMVWQFNRRQGGPPV